MEKNSKKLDDVGRSLGADGGEPITRKWGPQLRWEDCFKRDFGKADGLNR